MAMRPPPVRCSEAPKHAVASPSDSLIDSWDGSAAHAAAYESKRLAVTTTLYQAALSPSDVVAGMNAALRNARRLVSDAELLLSAGRWPTAASLAILSMEEAGKIVVLRRMAITSHPAGLKAAWKDYRSHQAKLKGPIGINPEGKSMADPTVLATAVQEHAQLVAGLDVLKQSGFYTDCIPSDKGQPIWEEPARKITEEQARELVACARLVTPKSDVSLRDVELFVEHLGPVWGTAAMTAGWRKWVGAMDSEGLLPVTRDEIEDRVLDNFFGKGWRATL